MGVEIRRPLKRLIPHLLKARDDRLNEASTVQRIIKIFEEVLEYDPMNEISHESQIKEKYVDIALEIDGNIRLLVEAKAAAMKLNDKHIEQAQHYAAEANIPWVVLTNGLVWTLYHLSFKKGIEYVKAFSVDLASDPLDEAAEYIGLLHRQSLAKGDLEEFWQRRVALSPESINKAVFTETVLRMIRREIRHREGIPIKEEDLAQAIHEMFSPEIQERLGPPKIKHKPKAPARTTAGAMQPEQPSTPSSQDSERQAASPIPTQLTPAH